MAEVHVTFSESVFQGQVTGLRVRRPASVDVLDELALQTFAAVATIVYGLSPNDVKPKEISVFPHIVPLSPRPITAYSYEIKIDLDAEDWSRIGSGEGEDLRTLYMEAADAIRLYLQDYVPDGYRFLVWLRGQSAGYADGFGTGPAA